MKRVIQILTIILLSVTLLYAFYPDSAHVVGFTRFWLATGEASGNRVAVRDSMDYIHIVYCYRIGGPYADSGEVFYAYSTDDGLTWSTPENVSQTDTCTSTEPNITIDSKGRLHCVWKQLYTDTSTTYYDYDMYYSQNSGTGWTPAVNISNLSLGANGCYSSMVVDSLDHVHVVYDMSVSSGNWDVYYSFYNDTVWTIPLQISNTPYDDAFPAMALDQNDHLHVVWRQRTTNAPVYYTKYDGNTWSTPEVITNFTGGQSAFPCIVVDSNNYPHVIWSWGELPADSGDIFYTAYDGVSWSSQLNLSNTVNVSCYHSMAIDSLDQLYVVWSEETPTLNEEVYYKTYNGTVWSNTINLTQDTSLSFCPKLGNPVKRDKVDLVWVDSWSARYVMYMGLNLIGLSEETRPSLVEKRPLISINPNPFRDYITIACNIPVLVPLKLSVYDISGRLVKVIFQKMQSLHIDEVSWSGNELSPGVYFLKLEGGSYSIVKKLVKLK